MPMDKKPKPISEPQPPLADPPHGGAWRRNEDGSLELLHTTQPAIGRRGAAPPAEQETSKE